MLLKSCVLLLTMAVHGSQSAYKVEPYSTGAYSVGEGPHWDYTTDTLYFVDSWSTHFYHEDHHTSPAKLDSYNATDPATIVIPYADSNHHLLVSVRNKLVKYDTTTRTAAPVAELAHERKEKFNDGKCDAMGRLWIGTTSDPMDPTIKGGLYKLQHDQLSQMATGFTMANGLAWSPDNTRLYLIDSGDLKIYVFDFELKNATLTNMRVFVDLIANPDFPDVVAGPVPTGPDGMTVDKSGNLWVSIFNGGRIVSINPKTARVEQSIPVPSLCTTTPIFGGQALDQMFVTTCMLYQDMIKYPNSGKVFRITSDEPGFWGARHASHFNPDI